MSFNAYFYEVDGALWFHLDKPAITQPSIPFVFDGPATESHKQSYPSQLKAFEKSKLEPVVLAEVAEEKPKQKRRFF